MTLFFPPTLAHHSSKLFLDYVKAMNRLPKLREQVLDHGVEPDASQASELEELARNLPRLINLLPDVLPDHHDLRYKAALSEMITGLTLLLDRVQPQVVSSHDYKVQVMR